MYTHIRYMVLLPSYCARASVVCQLHAESRLVCIVRIYHAFTLAQACNLCLCAVLYIRPRNLNLGSVSSSRGSLWGKSCLDLLLFSYLHHHIYIVGLNASFRHPGPERGKREEPQHMVPSGPDPSYTIFICMRPFFNSFQSF